MSNTVDLIIIGAGPAGLAASIYASRYGVEHSVIGLILGGQISETHEIDNYPGMENMSGFDFSQKWGHHVEKYGINIIPQRVRSIKEAKESQTFEIELENNAVYNAKVVLLATGTKRRQLNIPGEAEFRGKGVSYCATCDGFFYKNKTVGIIGGGDSAVGAALYLANICQKVYIIYRKNELRAEPFWLKLIENNEKIELIYETNVAKISGGDKLEKIELDKDYNGGKELKIDGLFIEAGSDPDISYAKDLEIKLDEGGYVKIAKDGATSMPGVWAAGDITDGSDKFRQVLTAAAEGAITARSIFNWLKKQSK
ncbi:MAG: Pyr redox 2 protein [Patescibacteria group bacterium]|nr:Pyr redox 2 protein [Patescibacteria group bacterium]